MQTLILHNESGDLVTTISRDRILNLDDGRYALTDEIAAIMSVCWVLDYPGALVIEVING